MIQEDLKKLSNPIKASVAQRFFKTGPGQYGHGDVFIGVTVPEIRKVAKKYFDADFQTLSSLLQNKIHEERLIATIILVNQYKKSKDEALRKKIFDFYLKNLKYINNWDLIDGSAEHIIGAYLKDKDKALLTKLAYSKNIWERRIAIMSTFHYIKQNQPEETLRIARILVNDSHDLIQKAVGWMLREVGKRCSETIEKEFLKEFAGSMPRTMLRYAIEKFSDAERKRFLNI